MTVLLIVKLLCDFSYYFLFAHYIGSFSGVSYSLPLTLAALVAAGTLSGLLEKRGKLRLLPAVAAFALLLQVRALPDAIVLLPPLLYLWTLCYKGLYWPDGDEYKDVFSIQWKLLLVLPLLLLLTLDLDAMQRNCLPLLVLFLATAVLSLRMMRHSPAVLEAIREAGLTERHARALLKLTDEARTLEAIEVIARQEMSVARAEGYIASLLEQRSPPQPKANVGSFLNNLSQSLAKIQRSGVAAVSERRETESQIVLTITIPK
jgi:hypothetical protein